MDVGLLSTLRLVHTVTGLTLHSIGCVMQKQLESQKQEYEKLLAQHTASTARATALEAEKQEMMQLLSEAVNTADQIRVSGSCRWLARLSTSPNTANRIRVSGSYDWVARLPRRQPH